MFKAFMTRNFLLFEVKDISKLKYKFRYTFLLKCFVDEIFQFELLVLHTNDCWIFTFLLDLYMSNQYFKNFIQSGLR